jgi:hypothetical protein
MAACGGEKGSTAPVPVGSVAVVATSTTLSAGQTVQLTATLSAANGAPLQGRPVTWSSANADIASVSATGLVTAGAVRGGVSESVLITASAEGRSATTVITVRPVQVASLTLDRATATLSPGESTSLRATTVDSTGAMLTGRAIAWSSRNATVATVDQIGLVTAIAAGTATIVATSEGREVSATIIVEAVAVDLGVADAAWSQAVQRGGNGGEIPLITGGAPAVLNAVVRPVGGMAGKRTTTLLLRLTNAVGATVHSDTLFNVVPASDASLAVPNAQFLVPAARIQPGTSWQVIRDPRGVDPDGNVSNDRFPATAAPLRVVAVQPLVVRFVPIVLAQHGGATGDVTENNLPGYLQALRTYMPFGPIEATVGTAYSTNASFGAAPAGGASTFWTSLLTELETARLADPSTAGAHWYGVVRPPAGFTSVSNGGWAFIRGMTALGVQTGWFSRTSQARDLVAHELAHNLGRLHSPCGGAGSPLDPTFPNGGGLIGDAGHDVYEWSIGLTNRAVPVAPSRGDVMGYCFPAWIHPYTYEALLSSRTISALQAVRAAGSEIAPPRTRVLVVRGLIEERRVSLEPIIAITARATADEGPVLVELLDAAGRVLLARRVVARQVDHAAVQGFVATLPVSTSLEARITQVRVSVPGTSGATVRARPLDVEAAPRRAGSGRERTVACGDARSQAVAVTDATTGALLGIARGARLTLPATTMTSMVVSCSDGVHTVERPLR